MDASLLEFRGGVRSLGKHKLADGAEHELYFKALSPEEVGTLSARLVKLDEVTDVEARVGALHKIQTKLIFDAMCNDDGTPLFASLEQAAKVPATLKTQLRELIRVKSNELTDDVPKD